MNQKNRVVLVVSAICLICLLTGFVHVKQIKRENEQHELIIPTLSEIREKGYPVNQNGERFGITDRDNNETSPELILAQNQEGLVGYIKALDMNRFSPTTPEEAANYQSKGYYVNMYMQDGETQIGTFYITEGNNQIN